jgi:hypothetical protein
MTMGTSNDALATIAGLKQRIEWLEESIGRLLVPPLSQSPIQKSLYTNKFDFQLEKEQNTDITKLAGRNRDNCCVTFTDASPDLERAFALGGTNNCCVSFRSTKIDAKHERRKVRLAVVMVFLFIMSLFFFGAFFLSGSRPNSNGRLNAEAALKLD